MDIIVTTNFVQLDSTKIDNFCIEVIRVFFLLINCSQIMFIYKLHTHMIENNLQKTQLQYMKFTCNGRI